MKIFSFIKSIIIVTNNNYIKNVQIGSYKIIFLIYYSKQCMAPFKKKLNKKKIQKYFNAHRNFLFLFIKHTSK